MTALKMSRINISNPFIIGMLSHRKNLLHIPSTQSFICTQYTQTLTITKLRSTDYQTHNLAARFRLHLLWNLMIDAIGKGAAIEESILRHSLPMIVKGINRSLPGIYIELMLNHKPFGLDCFSFTFYTIIIGIRFLWRFNTPVACPSFTICCLERKFQSTFLRLNVYDDLFAEHCFILNIKLYCHKTLKGS